jgi:hypothetical protein
MLNKCNKCTLGTHGNNIRHKICDEIKEHMKNKLGKHWDMVAIWGENITLIPEEWSY